LALAAALTSSEYDDWNTPEPVLERVRRIAPIGLDPFSNAQSIVRAAVEFRLDRGQDALLLDWRGHGLVFCNPPYGDAMGPCMRRMDVFGRGGVEILALIPHRTDILAYQENVGGVRAKCEWKGRLMHMRGVADQRQLSLLGAPAPLPVTQGELPAPFPSVVLYWGRRIKRFVDAFEGAGEIWVR
jgi:hypothetical protein